MPFSPEDLILAPMEISRYHFWVGPADPKDVARNVALELSRIIGELNAMRADAIHWLEGPEYGPLRHRLESAHAAAEAALVEARRRVRLNEVPGDTLIETPARGSGGHRAAPLVGVLALKGRVRCA